MKPYYVVCVVLLAACVGLVPACKKDQSETDSSAEEAQSAEDEWCFGHGLPESHCTKCHPELLEEFQEAGDWCEEHEFPESACPFCNPMTPPGEEAAAPAGEDAHSADNGEWCDGHGLPESHCTKCHPELAEEFQEAGDWCEEHGFPESACPFCNPMTPPGGGERTAIPGVAPGTQVVFRDEDHEEAAGIEVVESRTADLGVTTQVPARLQFNQDALADIRASVPGIVRSVLVNLGEEVEEGDALFELESARVGELQSEIRAAEQDVETARSNLERQQQLSERGLSATRRVEEAHREFEQAESQLGSLRSSLRLAGAGAGQRGRYTLRAPLSGTVIHRPAVLGSFATDETSLATVGDTSTMWAMLDVPERDAASVQRGQIITLAVEGRAEDVLGEITWISSEVDARTRAIAVRVSVDNREGALRANQFAHASIGFDPEAGVVVPRDAVQRIGDASVVFLRIRPGTYEPRLIEPGAGSSELVQVIGDLESGEPVVTTGAFILKTELTPDSIGAGCCEVGE